MSRKAIFLDRDGVINSSILINGKPYAPTKLSDLVILPGVIDSLSRFKSHQYLNVVVTNQPDLSTGKQKKECLEKIHNYLYAHCQIDLIKVCAHTAVNRCECRKPGIGMILEAARELEINLVESFMIGDRWSDVEAGQRAGCKEIFFIDYGYNEKIPKGKFTVVKSLKECADKVFGSCQLN